MRTGIDIVEVRRIDLNEKFLEKIADPSEIAYVFTYGTEQARKESCAGLWAVKEAVFKLLGLGKASGVAFKNVELKHAEGGRPYVELNGIALKKFNELDLSEIEVSISHTKDYAVAIAIAK